MAHHSNTHSTKSTTPSTMSPKFFPIRTLTQATTASGTKVPPHDATQSMSAELLAYYSQRRCGDVPEKPYEDWGLPESRTRKMNVTKTHFREVDWNSRRSDRGVDEQLSPSGGPTMSPHDVPPWAGEPDGMSVGDGKPEGRIMRGHKRGIGARKQMEAMRKELGTVEIAEGDIARNERVEGGQVVKGRERGKRRRNWDHF